jgi:hypothetical protein
LFERVWIDFFGGRKASKKSHIDSKCRVCHECRYLITQGATLDGRPWPDGAELNQTYRGEDFKAAVLKSTGEEMDHCYNGENLKQEQSTDSGEFYINSTKDDSEDLHAPFNVIEEIDALKNSMDNEALLLTIIENSSAISFAEAIFDFDGKTAGSMKFSAGHKLKIIKKGAVWWLAVNLTEEDIGWIPPNYVKEEPSK